MCFFQLMNWYWYIIVLGRVMIEPVTILSYIAKGRFRVQVELKLLTADLHIGRFFWIIQVGNGITRVLKLEEGPCRENQRRQCGRSSSWCLLEKGGAVSQVKPVASRKWTWQENRFLPRGPRKEWCLLTSWFLAPWDLYQTFELWNCKIINLFCFKLLFSW